MPKNRSDFGNPTPKESRRGTPPASSEAKARNMRAVKRRDTKPEWQLRRALHAAGLRYRVDLRVVLAGGAVRPDVVFPGRRVAVFVDSCFWHACPEHGTMPATNVEFWTAKLARNAARDAESDALLEAAGWRVVRAWEHEPTEVTVARIRTELDR